MCVNMQLHTFCSARTCAVQQLSYHAACRLQPGNECYRRRRFVVRIFHCFLIRNEPDISEMMRVANQHGPYTLTCQHLGESCVRARAFARACARLPARCVRARAHLPTRAHLTFCMCLHVIAVVCLRVQRCGRVHARPTKRLGPAQEGRCKPRLQNYTFSLEQFIIPCIVTRCRCLWSCNSASVFSPHCGL